MWERCACASTPTPLLPSKHICNNTLCMNHLLICFLQDWNGINVNNCIFVQFFWKQFYLNKFICIPYTEYCAYLLCNQKQIWLDFILSFLPSNKAFYTKYMVCSCIFTPFYLYVLKIFLCIEIRIKCFVTLRNYIFYLRLVYMVIAFSILYKQKILLKFTLLSWVSIHNFMIGGSSIWIVIKYSMNCQFPSI